MFCLATVVKDSAIMHNKKQTDSAFDDVGCKYTKKTHHTSTLQYPTNHITNDHLLCESKDIGGKVPTSTDCHDDKMY